MKRFTGIITMMALSVALSGIAPDASAQYTGDTIRIGLLTDMSGPYSDISGQGGVEAIKLAIADVGGKINGKKIEILFADHLNKADVGASKAREWLDREEIDVLMVGANSSVMLAVSKLAAEKKKPLIIPATATARVTNEDCSYYTIHYGYDTVAAARGTSSAVVRQDGKS